LRRRVSLLGSWTIDSANKAPTGITIDPANVSDVWVVDSGTDRVYRYAAAAGRISGSQLAASSFALAAGNTNPQGIADPPAMPATQILAVSESESASSRGLPLENQWLIPSTASGERQNGYRRVAREQVFDSFASQPNDFSAAKVTDRDTVEDRYLSGTGASVTAEQDAIDFAIEVAFPKASYKSSIR
jgi:hypothetical protein